MRRFCLCNNENTSIKNVPVTLRTGTNNKYQETGFETGEGVLVYFESKDGLWYFVQGGNYAGWTLKENIALCSKEDFDKFYSVITEILKEHHPKLNLSFDKRNMYHIYNKCTKYSEEIRFGVAESLVIIESIKSGFENCKIDASNFVILVVRSILNESNWEIWASLDQLLPYLAESSPSEFLNQFKDYLSRDKNKKLISEKEEGITIYNYTTSIYWSLELIAWNTDYCVQSGMILSDLAKFDKNVKLDRNH